MKRVLDVLLVLSSLPVTLPLIGLVALWIVLDGSGSVIHAQVRVGRGGREFLMHKFRTLYADREGGATVTPEGDPRITRPGQFLRRWRLDELPQLFDVLRGVMSLVGPRPERPQHLRGIPAGVRQTVYSVRPGLTGPAAIDFLAEDDYLATVADPVDAYCRILLPEKLRLEREYVERRSALTDLRILALTLPRVLSAKARRRSRAMIEQIAAAHGSVTTVRRRRG
ncbi:MAG: sugar transferase [Gammaproteobacteria bacterium]|nr:sugar transferase [Gammaproteobacteria bacterium]